MKKRTSEAHCNQQRPALATLVEELKEGRADVVVVEEAARLARNNQDLDGFFGAGDRPLKPK